MNIYKTYLDKIIKLIKSANKDNLLELPENLNSVTCLRCQEKFFYDSELKICVKVECESNEEVTADGACVVVPE